MSSYLNRPREPMTRERWIAVALAIAGAGLLIVLALMLARVVPDGLGASGKVNPVGPILWIIASAFLLRASAKAPGKQLSPRTLRASALFFFLFGLGLVVSPAILDS